MRIPERRKTLLGINMGGVATWIFLFCATTLFTQYAGASEPRVVCYYTNWSVYRPGTARFNPQNINPYLCTHLIYAFGGFTKDNTLKPFDKYQDIEKGGYAKFTGLKTYNSRLKTMLAIGGWNEGSSRFSPMVASKERRKEFVRNAIKFLRQNRFDGLDLDWEYPAFRDGGKPKDRDNYARLVRELRDEFEREAAKSGKPRLLLTMAVPAGIEYIQKGFDITALNKYLDWMNLLSYDYHSAFEPAVNHHAPLYPLEEPSEYSVDTELNIDYTIQYYLENGADRDKLVLGIPTYGRSYTLFNPDATELGAPADGPGEQGDATREKGYLAYYEICESLKDKPKKKRSIESDDEDSDEEESEVEEEDLPWTVVQHNPQAMGPVAFRGNQWVGYDDIDIVKKKAEYVADKGLGGIMFWSIDNDDFRGNCHGKPYPLIEAAKEAYITKLGITDNAISNERQSSSSSRRRSRPKVSSSTAAPTTRSSAARRKPSQDTKPTTPVWSYNTPEPPTTPDPGSDFKCTDEGFFPHPRDCKKYFWCLDSGPSNLGIVAHAFTCPSGLFFNKLADSCDFARNVLCKMPAQTTTSKPTTSTTSQPRTTTSRPAAAAASATTTTRRPNKLTSKSSVYFRTTTTTTPRSLLDEDEVYEDEIIEDTEAADVESEDPRVIKELIDLIKKAGGVEQLERHLKLTESSGSAGAGAGTTTPLPISKKLYQRVLEQTRQGGKNNLLDRYNSLSRDVNGGGSQSGQNSRLAPQNAGLENVPEASSVRKDRPQYTTINRSRPTTTTSEESDTESREDAEALEDEPRQSLLRARTPESGQPARPLPQYVNIRRARPSSTQSPADADEDSASRNALFERNEATILSTVTEHPPPASPGGRRDTPEYVTIRRTRPTTTTSTAAPDTTTTARYQTTERERPVYEETDDEASPPPVPAPAALQYSTLQRTRAPATPTPAAEPLTSPEPTTVLAVQISSLLNSPVTSQPERTFTEAALLEPEPTLPATAEPEPPTTVTDPPTTTTTTASAPVFVPTRRSILKRVRGTTSSTAAPTTAASQVSSERSYNIIRRRRPNEISSDSDPEGTPRKVRSTTPDSREASSNVQSVGEIGVVSRGTRYRRIRPSTTSDDSVASAAALAPVSRGRFRPALNRDELLSLTPIDDETPQSVPLERIAPRPERRFRPRNRPVTPPDAAPDAEASAATVEVRRPEFIPRGRSRFTASTTTEKAVSSTDIPSVEAVREERRPAFSRFTPRPFSRFGTTAPADQVALVSDNIPNESESEIAATPRSPVRLPFGRTRSPLLAPRTVVPQARIVSPLLRRPSSSTDASIKEAVPEDETEEKTDDIHLSESTIEEKEHEDKIEEPQDKPRSPVVLNVLYDNFSLKDNDQSSDTSSTSENDINASSVTPSDDSRRRKIKVIRRRPTSVAASASEEPVTEPLPSESTSASPSAPNRIRKIIRKKIIHQLTEPVTERDSIKGEVNTEDGGKLSVVLNYGDKARPVVFSAKTETEAIESAPSSESPQPSNTESLAKEDVAEVINHTAQETSSTPISNVLTSSEAPVKVNIQNDETPAVEITESPELLEATPLVSSTSTKSKFERPQYRPSKRLFTPSTEASAVPSSRTYSRKYNGGAYTSPATPDREATARSAVTRRPLFTSKPFLRRPFTARTTKKIEEEDYSEEEREEEVVEEPEAQLVLVPDNKLFTRGRHPQNNDDDLEESENTEDDIPEEQKEEKINKSSSRRPLFRPKSINSNTFRTSTSTTEIPKRNLSGTQNRTSIYNKSRLGLNDTKKRTQNVPVGYSILNETKTANETTTKTSVEQESEVETHADAETTTYNTDASGESTTDDDYLTATSLDNPTDSDKADGDATSTNTDPEPATATESMEVDTQTDDYLESSQEAQDPLTTDSPTTISQHVFSETHMVPNVPTTESSQSAYYEIDNELKTTESEEATTVAPEVAPVVETHFDKLFSVSRVVEVSSKLDKHRLNKKNESRLVETGKVMQEKKPTVDRIGEVSRFTLIKIVEDDIPIYLTKLGHVYPVANPPYNPIRIDEGRNARALVNFSDAGRENLVASESVNEAYRHINKFGSNNKASADKTDPQIELLKEDNYEVHHNAEDRVDKLNSYSPYPTQWQFVPAAYENDNTKEKHNKAAKSFEVITPRSYKTDPSTIALEGLFKTENPLLIMPRKVSQSESQRSINNQPFVVYAAPQADDSDPANFVKLQVLKPESGRHVKTFVRGQELSGASAGEETTVRYPVSITIFPSEDNKDDAEVMSTTDSIPSAIETGEATMTEPTTIGLTTPAPTTDADLKPTTDAAETATEPEVTTKAQVLSDSLPEYYAKKRSKLTFPRRPNFRNTNITRTSFGPLASQATTPRISKKSSLSPLGSKSNKTSGFNPSKSRFSANRSQNVPVDSRGEKKTKVGAGSLQRQNATEGAPTRAPPTAGGDSRKLYFKPIRPNLLRPAFVPRRPSTQPTTQSTTRRNFLRRTKPTDLPPAASESKEATTEAFPETTTRKFRVRGNSKFDKKRTTAKVTDDTKSKSTANPAGGSRNPDDGSRNPADGSGNSSEGSRKPAEGFRVKKRPSLLESETASAQTTGAVRRPTRTYVRRRYGGGGANATSTSPLPGSTDKSSAQSEVTRRPFRVGTRRRPAPAAPAASAASADEKPAHDLAVQESMERENNNKDHPPETKRPHIKKTVKIQRRPLTSLKKPEQSSTPTTTATSADSTTSEEPKKRESKKYSATFKQNQLDEVIRQKSAETGSKSEEASTESLEELSVDTAIAIAAHQLLGAPLPNTPSYEDDYASSSKKQSGSSTKAYVATTEPYTGYSNTRDYSRGGVTGSSAGAPALTSTIISTGGISSSPGISSTSPAYSRGSEVTRDFTRGSSISGVSSASPAYTRGVSSYVPSPSRYLSTTNKYVSVPIDEFGYSTDSYTSGLGHEPVYFTRDYLMESPVTRRYETDYQYLTTELPSTRQAKRPSSFRRISTTIAPASQNILILPPVTPQPRRVPNKGVKVYDKLPKNEKTVTYRPILNYDYYDDGDEKLLEKYPETSKVVIHGKGNIECLDQGNFPHPSSCRKFISCARMESGAMVGWEYVCPQGLSYDPVGGICNWSAGLGCHEN